LVRISDFELSALRRLVCAVLAAALLSGCPLAKPSERAPVVREALPPGTTIPPAWSAVASANDVSDDWLKSFNDPSLDAIVAEAIANNLDLRQAAARVEAARQTVIVVGSQLQPQIGARFGVSGAHFEGQDGTFQSNAEYFGVHWEIDLWGRLRAQRAASEAAFKATNLDYAFAWQSLAATAATSWYLAIETRQLVALAEKSVDIYTELLDLVKVRRVAGKVADLDVAEASANLNTAESTLRSTEGTYHEAQRNLEMLLGRYPGAESEVAATFPSLPPPVQAGLPSSLLGRRPDIIAAERQVLAAFRTQEAARLAFLPSFALTLDGGRLGDELLSVLELNPWLVHGAIGMNVPIYTGGALTANLKIATAQQQGAVAHYGAVVLAAFKEVEGALTNQQLLAQRLPYQEHAVADRAESVRMARMQYKAGAIALLSVLQLQETEITARAELIKLHNAQLANCIRLHLALGGSFDAQPAEQLTGVPG
jgi:multidrug efflux system outer membrane protein